MAHVGARDALLYAGYMLWLLAGLADFLCHRRTDLPHTSGMRESLLHLLQLALLGMAVILTLSIEMSAPLAGALTALVVVHAAVGYLDTRQAYGRRPILPLEQHLHSVLDMAPAVALVVFLSTTWPAAKLGVWAVRDPPLPAWLWACVLVPPALLCVLPALLELRDAYLAARART